MLVKDVVRPLYPRCFTVNESTGVSSVMGRRLADTFKSLSSGDAKNRTHLIGEIQFFWTLVPDLRWDVQVMFQNGSRVIVRSIPSGSPKSLLAEA